MRSSTRVALNTLVSYARSVAGLVFGLFSSRWILAALGQTDYGIYGVVGSVVAMATFLNIVLGASVSRFYSVTIGGVGDGALPQDGNDELQGWFNAALGLHVMLALIILSVGWPLGEVAIRHWLVIPAERITSSLWVFRASLGASALSVATAPYVSMFTAWQRFGELALFEFLRTGATFVVAGMLLAASGDRLVILAFAFAGISSVLALLQMARARVRFGACRFDLGQLFQFEKMRELMSYAGCRILGVFGWLAQRHGGAFVVNMSFGAKANAALSVAYTVVTHASALANALAVALAPALATEIGKGERTAANSLALKSCKFSGILAAICAVPLLFEMNYVLRLWLHSPPDGAATIASAFMLTMGIEGSTTGIVAALLAIRHLGRWQMFECLALSATCPVAWCLFRRGMPVTAFGNVLIVVSCVTAAGRIWFAKKMLGISPRDWLRQSLLPLAMVFAISICVACGVRMTMEPSPVRVMLVGVSAVCATLLSAWGFAFDGREKTALIEQVFNRRVLTRRERHVDR